MAAALDVTHDDGRKARMSRKRFEAVASEGWHLTADLPKPKARRAAPTTVPAAPVEDPTPGPVLEIKED